MARTKATARKRVGLALAGGSVRGMAHVGVFSVLERERIPVDCVAGTSAGSVVGAAYAAGIRAERLEMLAHGFRWRRIARPCWPRYGLVSFARMETYLAKVLGDLTFAQLKIPYACVAADLETGELVVLREGPLAPAVRASCSVPGLVAPVHLGGRWLVDGGVMNNLPISVVRELGADVVIAVNLNAPPPGRPRHLWDILDWASNTIMTQCGDDPGTADVYIPLPLTGLANLLRVRTGKRTMARGVEAAEKALPKIREALGIG